MCPVVVANGFQLQCRAPSPILRAFPRLYHWAPLQSCSVVIRHAEACLAPALFRSCPPTVAPCTLQQPNIGGEVVPHTDSTFLFTDPPTVVGLWLALEDATVDNGCLFTLPGAHKAGVQRRMTQIDGGVTFDREPVEYNLKDFVPVEVCWAGVQGQVIDWVKLQSGSSWAVDGCYALMEPEGLIKAEASLGCGPSTV